MKQKITLLIFLFAYLLQAQQATLVKDINASVNIDASVQYLTELNGKFFFSAREEIHGSELWVSDGTAAGTHMLVDIDTGSNSSDPRFLKVLNGKLYFRADDRAFGQELWVTDGTPAGTKRITDLNPGKNSSGIENLEVFDGRLYFLANDGVHGNELWSSDGTALGTTMVKDIYVGSNGSGPSYLTVYNNKLYFSATNGISATELWVTDGTEVGTQLVKDINPNGGHSSPREMTVYNNKMYFSASDGHQIELWESDGTEVGTKLSVDIHPSGSSYPLEFTVFNSKLYFHANGGTNGTELWESDGTAIGTKEVKDINPGSGNGSPRGLTVFQNKLYFRAYDSSFDQELWVSDGTDAGTQLFKNIYLGQYRSSSPSNLFVFNNQLFFSASTENNRNQLWVTDGTDMGTEQLLIIGNKTNSSAPRTMMLYNNEVYFSATDNTHGRELWKTDGTALGTVMIKDVFPGSRGGTDRMIGVFNGKLYFQGTDAVHGEELWVTDGTETGTKFVIDINTGTDGSNPEKGVVLNNKLYFVSYTNTNGEELWVTDGTEAGTHIVKDIYPGSNSGFVTKPVLYNNKLYFGANDGVHGKELWESDGTEVGTKLTHDIYLGTNLYGHVNASNPGNFTVFDNKFYFTANDGVHGTELWESDGTIAGTKLFMDIDSGGASSSPDNLIVFNNKLHFDADDGVHGAEPWATDGTELGTQLVADINVGISGSGILFPTVLNDRLYFRAGDGIHGSELWETDGTAAGTKLTADINKGNSHSNLDYIIAFNGELLLEATDGIHGEELIKYTPFDCGALPSTIVYVSASGTITNNGASWAEATSLENALNIVATCPSVQEIWMQQGTYKAGIDRFDTFTIPSNIKIYGGFQGTETSLLERNWKNNPTILSGDIGIPNQISGNTFTLLTLENTENTIIDGFVLEEGNAELDENSNLIMDTFGGAIFLRNSNNNTISNCVFRNNHGLEGAAVYQVSGTNNQFINCLFYGNEAQQTNPIFAEAGTVSIVNGTLANNTAITSHGILGVKDASITFSNSILAGTHALNFNSTGSGVLSASYSYLKGENPAGTQNIDGTTVTDVLFRDAANHNYALQQSSPLIDQGDNTLNSLLKSLEGNTRVFDGDENTVATIDIGAFEFNVNDITFITQTTISADNGFIEVTFNHPIYNTNVDSGAVEIADFLVQLSGGVATTPVVTSITNTLDEALTGGETQIRIHYTYSNPADGTEILQVNPVSNSVYNNRSALSVNQTNNTATFIRDKVLTASGTKNVETLSGVYANIILENNNHVLVAPGTGITVGKMETNGNSSIRLLSDVTHGPAQLHQKGNQDNNNVNFYQELVAPIKSKYAFSYFSSPVNQNDGETYQIQHNLRDGRRNHLSADYTPESIDFSGGLDGAQEVGKTKVSYEWIYGYINGGIDGNWDFKKHNTNFNVGEGFTMKSPGGTVQRYVYQGQPNNGTYTKTLVAGTHSLLGNPYTNALNADKFIQDNLEAITGTLYFYEDKSSTSHNGTEYESGYNTYNLGGGVAAAETIHGDTPSVLFRAPKKHIAVGQGFFVEADSDGGTLVFKNSQRVNMSLSGDSRFFKTQKLQSLTEKESLRIGVEFDLDNDQVYHRQLGLTLISGKTLGLEKGYESELFDEKSSDAYLNFSNKKLVLSTINNTSATQRVPLVFNLDISRTIKVMIDEEDLRNKTVYVLDTETNKYYNLKSEVFEMALNAGVYNDRFKLVINPSVADVNQDTLSKDEVIEDTNDVNIVFKNKSFTTPNEAYRLRVVNMLGEDLDNDKLSKGLYIVQVIDKITSKIVDVKKMIGN